MVLTAGFLVVLNHSVKETQSKFESMGEKPEIHHLHSEEKKKEATRKKCIMREKVFFSFLS